MLKSNNNKHTSTIDAMVQISVAEHNLWNSADFCHLYLFLTLENTSIQAGNPVLDLYSLLQIIEGWSLRLSIMNRTRNDIYIILFQRMMKSIKTLCLLCKALQQVCTGTGWYRFVIYFVDKWIVTKQTKYLRVKLIVKARKARKDMHQSFSSVQTHRNIHKHFMNELYCKWSITLRL